jgi:hypothetical protein
VLNIQLVEHGPEIDVYKLVKGLTEHGLRAPILIRFLDTLGNKIERLSVREGMCEGHRIHSESGIWQTLSRDFPLPP